MRALNERHKQQSSHACIQYQAMKRRPKDFVQKRERMKRVISDEMKKKENSHHLADDLTQESNGEFGDVKFHFRGVRYRASNNNPDNDILSPRRELNT